MKNHKSIYINLIILLVVLLVSLSSCNYPTPVTETPGSTCELVANSDITTYYRPSFDADVFSSMEEGESVLLEGRTADGWLGFNPGVPQAPNLGPFRLRWINENEDFTLQGECDDLTEFWGPPAGVCFSMQWVEANVYEGPDTSSEVIATLSQGDFAEVLERIADDWAKVDLSVGNTGLDGIGWIEGDTFELNGPCDDIYSSRCIPDKMLPPSLSSPQDDEILDTLQPLFSWADPNDCQPEGYAVGVSLNPDMEQQLFGELEYPESTWQPSEPLSPGTQYWWTVQPIISSTEDSDGSTHYIFGPASEVQSFFTGPLCDELVAPELVQPADGEQVDPRETIETKRPTFIWDYPDACLPDMYQLMISKTPDVGPPLTMDYYTESPTTRWQIDIDLEENTEYYWHARAINGNGAGPLSEVRSFITSEIDPNMPGVIAGVVWDDTCANPFPRDDYPEGSVPPPGCIWYSGIILGDGVMGSGENGISGVTVRIASGECPPESEGSIASSGPTDEEGQYYYYTPAGTYCVYVDAAEEANSGILQPGTWSSPNPDALSWTTVTIEEAGQILEDVSFGWDYRYKPEYKGAAATTEPGTKFDLTGSWTGTLIQELQSGICGPMPSQQGDVQIIQTGDTFTMQFGIGFACDPAEACFFTGTIDGDTYTAMNLGFADDEGGVYETSLIMVPMAPNAVQASGSSTYTHPDMECEWVTSLILTR